MQNFGIRAGNKTKFPRVPEHMKAELVQVEPAALAEDMADIIQLLVFAWQLIFDLIHK